jgi:hypothetical protein
MAAVIPGSLPAAYEEQARAYAEAKEHKAQAASIQPPGFWRATGRGSAEAASEAALESCQIALGSPCALLAVDSTPQPIPQNGKWPTRDMARSMYVGPFDPQQIPGASPNVRRQASILGYSAAPAPKAAAYSPAGGRVFTVTGAADQRAAEEQALRACEADTERRRFGAACFLYAVVNQVVLTQRRREPLSDLSFRDGLLARLALVLPSLSSKLREERVLSYEQAQRHKAQAAAPNSTASWWVERLGSSTAAEERALEACQVHAGQPCVLLAVNHQLQPIASAGNWPRRDMPRVGYVGHFDPERIPAISSQVRGREDIAGYRAAAASKAAVLHPSGRVFTASDRPDQRSAEEQALSACKVEIARLNLPSRCFLYAIGDQIVLHQRRTEPIDAAALGSTRTAPSASDGSIRLLPP